MYIPTVNTYLWTQWNYFNNQKKIPNPQTYENVASSLSRLAVCGRHTMESSLTFNVRFCSKLILLNAYMVTKFFRDTLQTGQRLSFYLNAAKRFTTCDWSKFPGHRGWNETMMIKRLLCFDSVSKIDNI